MKKLSKQTICILLFLHFAFINLAAQKNSFKFGKVDKSELEMTSYPNDTAASAVTLFQSGYTSYDYINNKFRVNTEIIQRIKILKQEGVDEATISLKYYCYSNFCDNIERLEAYSYNLEDNNITKTKLEKKYIFEEKISERFREKKFAIPNVKVGSVIEYRYTLSSDAYFNVPDWTFQSDIPVKYARYEIVIPEYFVYNIESRGYEPITTTTTDTIQTFKVLYDKSIETVSCTSKKSVYILHDIPAMNEEKHVWCIDDFLAAIRFELRATQFPYSYYKLYSQTWKDIDKTIKENTDFVSNINKSNPYKKEINALLNGESDEKKKIEIIYQFLKEKIRWNEKYAFTSNPMDAIKDGTGNNAQINAILMSMLKDAGITAHPVLLSRRSLGRIPFTHPSLDKLNTFIVMAVCSNGERCFMDGSAYYGGINMLPTDLLVDRARIYGFEGDDQWIDLTGITKNQIINLISASISDDGSLKGTYSTMLSNQPAYAFKKMFNELKDSTGYVEKASSELTVNIDSLVIEGHKNLLSNRVQQKMNFTKNSPGTNEYIYINPLIFPHFTQNDFVQSDRKLPIEFNYPYSYTITSIINIPENYTVEEMPRSGKMILEDNSGVFTYLTNIVNDRTIHISYRFDLRQTIISQLNYKAVREFWGEVASKNNQMLVLKKKLL